MSVYEGSKIQESDEDNKRHEIIAKKNIIQKNTSPNNETAGYSDVERIKVFVEIFEKANQLNVRSFIQWCDKEDWFFVKPIKTPKLKV